MKKKPIDEIDLRIINQLQNNAGITNRSLAKIIGLSFGPTLVRVQNLWKRGFLKNCRAKINCRAFGFVVKAAVYVSLPNENRNRFLSNVKTTREVICCFELFPKSQVIKSHRFVVIMMAKSDEDLKELIMILCRGSKVQDIEVSQVLKTHKDSPLLLTEADT